MSEKTKEQIDQEYSNVALILGHKTRVLAQIKAEAKRVEAEMQEHINKLLELNAEGMKVTTAPKLEEVKAEAPAEGQA